MTVFNNLFNMERVPISHILAKRFCKMNVYA